MLEIDLLPENGLNSSDKKVQEISLDLVGLKVIENEDNAVLFFILGILGAGALVVISMGAMQRYAPSLFENYVFLAFVLPFALFALLWERLDAKHKATVQPKLDEKNEVINKGFQAYFFNTYGETLSFAQIQQLRNEKSAPIMIDGKMTVVELKTHHEGWYLSISQNAGKELTRA